MLQLFRKNKRHIAQNVLNWGLFKPHSVYPNVVQDRCARWTMGGGGLAAVAARHRTTR